MIAGVVVLAVVVFLLLAILIFALITIVKYRRMLSDFQETRGELFTPKYSVSINVSLLYLVTNKISFRYNHIFKA